MNLFHSGLLEFFLSLLLISERNFQFSLRLKSKQIISFIFGSNHFIITLSNHIINIIIHSTISASVVNTIIIIIRIIACFHAFLDFILQGGIH